MTNTNKVTKREYFNALTAYLNGEQVKFSNDELKAFITHEVELLNRKNNKGSTSKVESAKITANNLIKADIITALKGSETPLTITDLMKVDTLIGYSCQKLSALVTQLINEGEVIRIKDKRVSRFTIKVEG